MNFETLMRNHDPAADVTALPERRATQILDSATAAQPRRRTGRMAVAAAAVLAAGALFASTVAGPQYATADEVLEEAAINTVDEPARPEQYWEISTTTVDLHTTEVDEDTALTYAVTYDEKEYVAVDRQRPTWSSRQFIEATQLAGDPVEFDGAWAVEGVETSNLAPADFDGADGFREMSPAWVDALPRDPALLLEAFRAEAHPDSFHGQDHTLFDIGTGVLLSGLPDAELRSAIFTALRELPGIEISDEALTMDGRTGVALRHRITEAPVIEGASAEGFWTEVVVDPADGQIIGMRRHTPAEWKEGGLEFTRTTTYHRTLVDDVPAEIRDNATHYDCVILPDSIVDCSTEA